MKFSREQNSITRRLRTSIFFLLQETKSGKSGMQKHKYTKKTKIGRKKAATLILSRTASSVSTKAWGAGANGTPPTEHDLVTEIL